MNIAPGVYDPRLFELDVLMALHQIEAALWIMMAVNAVLWGLVMIALVSLARRARPEVSK